MARITINGISLDPVTQSQALTAASLVSADASQSNYILIQTHEPLTNDQKAQLASMGVEIHEYVPDNTYLCSYQPTDLGTIRALPYVVWANVYLRGFKIAPELRPPMPAPAAFLIPLHVNPSLSRTVRTVDVVLHQDVDPNSSQLKNQIASAARLNPDNLQTAHHKVRLAVQERYLDDLTKLDTVRSIEEVPQMQLFNNRARSILNAQVVVSGATYAGDGQVIAVADTGFDLGSTTNVHPAFTGRVARLYALGRTNPPLTDDPDGHGTHVAGSALSNGSSSSMGGAIQGTAPQATLVLQSLLDSFGGLGGIPSDLNDLFDLPYHNDGARIHTNSWGPRFPGLRYDESAREVDEFVWNHQDCVICFAAGNNATDSRGVGMVDATSIGSMAAAKNCITVGASESNRPEVELTYRSLGFPAAPIANDKTADNPEGMVAFSSRGLTQEGRYKPDIVAPGTSILSTRSRAAITVPSLFGVSSDPAFFFDSGTSMATPLVAGCIAVLRETLVKNGLSNPTAALLKALLINGAVNLVGQYSPTEVGLSPNGNDGFGRVDLASSVILPGSNPRSGFGEGAPLNQGGEDAIDVRIPQSQLAEGATTGLSSLKVTLVWTDPPGSALQNDLDLIVRTADGQERHGNMGTSSGFDRSNNVEQIVWDNIPAGDAKIIVRAARITRFAQPYAYAWHIS